jgi:thymidylate synthase (FAD)
MIVRPAEVLVPASELNVDKLKKIERYARVCYKSEGKMDAQRENPAFLLSLLSRGHESVIEHEKITVLFVIDRGVSHELVRHRIGSYSQESTRYCNYSREQFGREITVIAPHFFAGTPRQALWEAACRQAETAYFALLDAGASPQEARSVLPTCLKTEIAVTFNLREWRHFFALRAALPAHPQIREVAIPLLLCLRLRFPAVFADIEYDRNFPPAYMAPVRLTDDLFRPLPSPEAEA